MNFTVQELNLDLINELKISKDYWTWRNTGIEFNIWPESYRSPDSCPIGSVEFCQNYFKDVLGKTAKPRNIPRSLLKYSGRKVSDSLKDFNQKDIVFIKSWDTIKDPLNGKYLVSEVPHGNYQVSEYIPDIDCEYRVFVYKGAIIDMKQYGGDPFGPKPRREFISDAIKNFSDAPVAYTLDVFIRESGECGIMEVHDFFGCGLYGFDDHERYPFMLWRWFREFKEL